MSKLKKLKFSLAIVISAVVLSVVAHLPSPQPVLAGPPVTATCKKPDDGLISAEWKADAPYEQNQTVRIDLWDLPGLSGTAQQWPAAYQHTFWNPNASTNCNQVIFQFPEAWINSIDVVAHDENAESGLTINSAIIDASGNTLGWSQKYIAWDSSRNTGNLTTGASCPPDDHRELKEPRADQCFVSIGGVSIKAKTNQLRFNDLDRSSNEDVIFRLMNVNAVPVLKCQLWSDTNTIVRGQSTTLRWNSQYATAGWIDGVQDTTPTSGDRSISPTASTTYSATFFDSNGQQATCEHRVTVTEPPPTPLSCGSVSVSPLTIEQGSTNSPTLNCTSNGDTVAVYKVTRPSNTPTGTPTVSAVPPNLINNLTIPTDQINEGSYPVSCVPCTDVAMTNCAPVIPACSTSLTVTPRVLEENECGEVESISADIIFTMTGGKHDVQTIYWTQQKESPQKTGSFVLGFYPDNTLIDGAKTVKVLEYDARVNKSITGKYSITLGSLDVKEIHENLIGASTDILHIYIKSNLSNGLKCIKNGVEQIYPDDDDEDDEDEDDDDDDIKTKDRITVKVRDGESCVGDAIPAISGTLAATWPPSESKSSAAPDFTVDIPTGTTLTSTYDFTSNLYACVASCSPANTAGQCWTEHNKSKLEAAIYVSQLNITSWWETIGGLAYGAILANPLPVNSPVLCDELILTAANFRKCAPYGARSTSFKQNNLGGLLLGGGTLGVSAGWSAERSTPSQSAQGIPTAHKNALKKLGTSSYDYYHSLVSAKATLFTMSGGTLSTLASLPNSGSEPQYYQTQAPNGSLTIDPSATLTIGAGQKIIIFVNGDLTIGNDSVDPDSLQELIKVEPGGFLAMFVKNAITIKSSVGTTVPISVEPNASSGIGQTSVLTNANVAGMYIADGPIIIESNDNTNIPDKRFIGEGSFVSSQPIVMKRSFGRETQGVENSKILAGFSPSEVFRYRPDIMLATPPELRTHLLQYQEIN